MNIKELINDYGTTQQHIRIVFKVSKGLVSRWTNISVPEKRYDEIKQYLKERASSFLTKY